MSTASPKSVKIHIKWYYFQQIGELASLSVEAIGQYVLVVIGEICDIQQNDDKIVLEVNIHPYSSANNFFSWRMVNQKWMFFCLNIKKRSLTNRFCLLVPESKSLEQLGNQCMQFKKQSLYVLFLALQTDVPSFFHLNCMGRFLRKKMMPMFWQWLSQKCDFFPSKHTISALIFDNKCAVFC